MSSALFFPRNRVAFLLAIFAAAVFSACGGDGDGGTSYPSITYTGSTTAAVIDQSNAADFPFVVLEGSSGTGNIPVPTGIDSASSGGIPSSENIKKAASIISDLIKTNLVNGANLVTAAATSQTNSGSCGGKATYSDNNSSSSFNGSIQFDNFCEVDSYGYRLSLHGRLTYSGTFYLDANDNPVLTSFNLTVEYLKIVFTDGSTTVSNEFAGGISVTGFDPTTNEPLDFTMSINFKHNGKVFKIVNLQLNDAAGTISGRFYHPDHGYVDVSTTVPFVYDAIIDKFCGGTLHIEGVDNAVPPNTATIDFTSDLTCSTYDICITIGADPQLCSIGNDWGTAPAWP
jgi:hypothetical protein